MNNLLKYGAYMGGGLIIYTFLLYFIDKPLLFGIFTSFIIPLMLKIVLSFLAGKNERSLSVDGTFSYGEAVKSTFIPWVIGSLIFTIFYYILFNFIDPCLIDIMKQSALDMAETISGLVGADKVNIEEVREEVMQQEMNIGLGTVILDFIQSLIGGILISLILAIFLKRE